VPYVRGCNILSNGVAKVKPIIHRRTPEGRERAKDHPAWKFVTRRANPLLSASLLRKVVTFRAISWGNPSRKTT
jgi:phage portal protein BeeE